MNSQEEIKRFKTEINLSEYLASKGFKLDEKSSCTAYAVMRNNDQKFVVTKSQDGHYVFTDAHNPKTKGTVIDACQALTGKNLGQVRRELRSFSGENTSRPQTWQRDIKKSEPDYAKIAISFDSAKPVFDYKYFRERNISKKTVNAFPETIRQSQRGTLLFRHKSPQNSNLSGYEYKSSDVAGFSKGGRKGLAIFKKENEKIEKIVICETALDALSKAEIDGLPRKTAYVSLGGNPSNEQLDQLKRTIEKHDLKPIIAVDRDRGGDLITNQIKAVLPQAQRDLPKGKDFNDDLRNHKKFKAQGFELSM